MPVIENLTFKSEYVVSHLECSLEDKDEYLVIQTPSKPNYYFGNFLVLKVPLDSYTLSEWKNIFKKEFSELEGVVHYNFTWPRSDTESTTAIEAFKQANFDFDETHVLAMKRKDFHKPTLLNTRFTLRPIKAKSEWAQWVDLNVAENKGQQEEVGFRKYLKGRIQNYRNLEKEQLGETLGAFDGDKLVGYAGLYHLDGLGRFQNVHVIPTLQNQKLAKTLLTNLIARTPQSVHTLAIVAVEQYHASLLYQSLGFKIAEREGSLCWWPGKAPIQT